MTKEEMIEWIDKADYYTLLEKWRFGELGCPFFVGEVGEYYSLVMHKRKAETGDNGVSASKALGW